MKVAVKFDVSVVSRSQGSECSCCIISRKILKCTTLHDNL